MSYTLYIVYMYMYVYIYMYMYIVHACVIRVYSFQCHFSRPLTDHHHIMSDVIEGEDGDNPVISERVQVS